MLKQASFGLAVLAVVGFAPRTVALGQDTVAKPKSFANDYMVGSWTVEGTADGKAVKGTMRVHPTAKGACLMYNWALGPSQDDMVRGLGVAARDPKTAEIIEYGFESDGTQFIQRYPAESFPNTGVGYGQRIGTVNGKPYKGKITVDRRGRQEFLFTVASELGEDVKFTFRRVQNEQTVSPAYEYLKELEDYIGNWICEDTLSQDMPGLAKKGEKVMHRASVRWIQNKSAMQIDFVSTGTEGKSVNARWIFNWDAAKKTIMYSGFDTVGGRVWGTLKKESPDKWVFEDNWNLPAGTQGSGTDTAMMRDNNNTHLHQFTNRKLGGQPQPDGQMVYKRLK